MGYIGETGTTKPQLGLLGRTTTMVENSAAGIQGANAHSQTHAMPYASTVKVQQKKLPVTSNAWHTQQKNTGSTSMATPETYENLMKIRTSQPTAALICPATRITIDALAAIRAQQPGLKEKDHHWKALKCLLAGDLPQPTALHQCPDLAQQKKK